MDADRPLTERQEKLLVVLLDAGHALTGNEMGYALNLPPARRARGPWSGFMGPAQRVIGSVRGLDGRGLVALGRRRDGRSGTAYTLTPAGRRKAVELKGRG